MANKIIPFLVPLSIENGLTISQFNTIMAMVKDMLQRVETEHRSKLEQLNSIKNDSKDMDLNFQASTGPLVPSAVKSPSNDIDKTFSNLGLDNYLDNTFQDAATARAVPQSLSNLSLADKQRIVAQQEMSQRMQTQSSPITPVATQVKLPTKPKDLTATLIESNLSQIKSPTSPPTPQTWSTTTNTTTGWNNFGQFQAAPTNAWQQVPKTASNLNSLNSLLPQKEKIPMNQMQLTSMALPPLNSIGLINSNNNVTNGNQQGTKTLSQADIMDLLG